MSIVHWVLAMRLPYRGVYKSPPKVTPQRQLQVATENLDRAYILKLLSQGVDPKLADHNGDSVLHLAFKRLVSNNNHYDDVQSKIIKVLEIYLDHHGLKVNRKNAWGESILYLAIKNRLELVIKFLLNKGARFDSPDWRGNTTLHLIVEHEFDRFSRQCSPNDELHEEGRRVVQKAEEGFLKWLLSNATRVDCKNLRGYTPLSLAAKHNLLHLVLLLLTYTKDPSFVNKKHKTAFLIFIEAIVQFDNYERLQEGIPTFCYDEKYVARIVQSMLDKGFSIDAADVNGDTPILVALRNQRMDIARTMLEYPIKCFARENDGMEFHDGFFSFVQLAVINKNVRVLRNLQENSADFGVLYRGNNLLHLLSINSAQLSDNSIYDAIVDLLINQGCHVNLRNDDGMTPLHLASQAGIFPIVKRLIEYGANVHNRELSDRRLTALHQAVDNNRDEVIELLVNSGADVNARTADGQTPLHMAMLYESNMAKTLLRLGAHVDVMDDEGRVPLYDAICYHNITALRELLNFGADINDRGACLEIANLAEVGAVMSTILEHWVKLQAAGLPADNYYRYQLVDRSFQTFYDECLGEAEKLKDCLLNDGLSIHKLLLMSADRRCNYVASTKQVKVSLFSSKLVNLFPKYRIVIQACYHEAIARYSLLELAKCAWCEITGFFLPDNCVDMILSHLNNMTLRSMVDSSKDRSPREGC